MENQKPDYSRRPPTISDWLSFAFKQEHKGLTVEDRYKNINQSEVLAKATYDHFFFVPPLYSGWRAFAYVTEICVLVG